MAKKKVTTRGILSFDSAPAAARGSDPVTSKTGVGLKESEWLQLGEIAAELGLMNNKGNPDYYRLIAYAVREFIKRWNKGERPKTATRTITELK